MRGRPALSNASNPPFCFRNSAPDGQQTCERRLSSLGMRVGRFGSAKCYDFPVAVDRRLVIISAMLSKMTFHQPGFRVARINAQNPVKKDLSDIPSFFGHRTCSVRPINSDLGVISAPGCIRLALEKSEPVCHVGFQNEPLNVLCQEICSYWLLNYSFGF